MEKQNIIHDCKTLSIFIEKLDFQSFFILFKRKLRKHRKVFYIDSSYFLTIYKTILIKIFNYKLEKINFKLINIKEDSGELTRLSIERNDLFKIQKKIKKDFFLENDKDEIFEKRLNDFVLRELMSGGILNESSLSRFLFILKVIQNFKENNDKNILIIEFKDWYKFLSKYLKNDHFKIIIKNYRFEFKVINILNSIFYYSLRFHNFLFNLKFYKRNQFNRKKIPSKNLKIYSLGRGDVSFDKKGSKSDFFWLINSNINNQNVIHHDHIKPLEGSEISLLNKNNIDIVIGPFNFFSKNILSLNYKIKKLKIFKYKATKNKLKKYIRYYREWQSIFKKFNIKIILHHWRFSGDHYIMNDAINDIGGVSALYQVAFNGNPIFSCQSRSDIFFVFSKFSAVNEINTFSKSKYYIISGLTYNYAAKNLREKARLIKNKIKSKGAKKIISVFDEYGTSDDRWQTGMTLQEENYSYIINEILSNKTLGVIFKPKVPHDLKKRLGNTYDLLREAINTGRCKILDDTNKYNSSNPAILAGLASDISIHGHLSAGTAAIECASLDIPVILIDREGCPYSKLYDLPKEKVIFNSWKDALVAVREFDSKDKKTLIGNWSSIIEELDPFRDGLAASRIGNYLKWILDGFEKKEEKDLILERAAENYTKLWGKDKIIF